MNPTLFGLAWRRVCTPVVLLLLSSLCALVAGFYRASAAGLAATLEPRQRALESAVATADLLLGSACLAAALGLWSAAASFRRWSRGERHWLAAASDARWLWTWWLGSSAGALTLLALALFAAPALLGFAPLRGSLLQRFEHPARLLSASLPAWSIEIAPRARSFPGAERLVIDVRSIGAAPAANLELCARRASTQAGPDAERRSISRVHAARRLELELPPGDGPLTLSAEVSGGAALLYVAADSLRLTTASPVSARNGILRWAYGWLGLVPAASALALGLGAWLRPSMALGGVFALALGLEVLARAWPQLGPWFPWRTLGEAWRMLRAGYAANGLDFRGALACVAAVAAGLALARWRARRWSWEA